MDETPASIPHAVDERKHRFSLRRFVCWLPVYLVLSFSLYVMSIGPQYWAVYESYFFDNYPLLNVLYRPLVRLSGVSDRFANWLEWYVGLWIF